MEESLLLYLCYVFRALINFPCVLILHERFGPRSVSDCGTLMAFALSLILNPTFGIYFHKTLDAAQPYHLLKPN